MLSWRRLALLAAAAIESTVAQPALTTIQDILYRADGTRFTGTMIIRYNSFLAGDTANIATSNITLPIVNGTLLVRLAPTTTASPGAQYSVTYNSRGINQYVETWAVPPSLTTLRVRDVRVAPGTVVGPPIVITAVQIGDVVGLTAELASRPMKGVGFAIGRAAVINQAGQVDGAVGNLGDCVHVDGSSGTCGGGGSGDNFADAEVPAGAINGVNSQFTLVSAPSPASSLELYRNGLVMRQGADYQITGNAITFFLASVPQSGDLLVAYYRFASPTGLLSSLRLPQVVCSSTGSSTSSTTLIELGSCTIPAGLLGAGVRVEIQFQYGHTGTAQGFTATVLVGGTTVASRAAGATETVLAGHTSFGIDPTGQAWDTQSWGTTLSFSESAGTASEDISQAVRVSLRGQMASSTTDTVVLRNFTVTRYPALSNP